MRAGIPGPHQNKTRYSTRVNSTADTHLVFAESELRLRRRESVLYSFTTSQLWGSNAKTEYANASLKHIRLIDEKLERCYPFRIDT
jgi:hypothetical protein